MKSLQVSLPGWVVVRVLSALADAVHVYIDSERNQPMLVPTRLSEGDLEQQPDFDADQRREWQGAATAHAVLVAQILSKPLPWGDLEFELELDETTASEMHEIAHFRLDMALEDEVKEAEEVFEVLRNRLFAAGFEEAKR